MPCYHPLRAFKTAGGDVVFSELRRYDIAYQLSLPCGQCYGCRLERSRQWAMRCMHEASAFDVNAFVTLTYDDAHLPSDGSLRYRDYQLFMKRLRKVFAPRQARFYMGGEYGSETFRPHYHACLFNVDFADKVPFKKTGSGMMIYTSSILEQLWPFGLSSIGDVTFESAAYVARYCMQKVTGRGAASYYERIDPDTGEIYSLTPEFNKMSLKPGIGATWYSRFKSDVYPHDYVVVRGKEVKPPKYYDTLFDLADPFSMDEVKMARVEKAKTQHALYTPERLAVLEECAELRLKQLKRGYENDF